jgi:hypothetical protein
VTFLSVCVPSHTDRLKCDGDVLTDTPAREVEGPRARARECHVETSGGLGNQRCPGKACGDRLLLYASKEVGDRRAYVHYLWCDTGNRLNFAHARLSRRTARVCVRGRDPVRVCARVCVCLCEFVC